MAGKEALKTGMKVARPVLSTDFCEARRRAIGLYRAFYRFMPQMLRMFDIAKTECEVKQKIREYFYKNACVTDMRVIDILVIKGYMELKELDHNWQQKGKVLSNWDPTVEPKPCDFISKFIQGSD